MRLSPVSTGLRAVLELSGVSFQLAIRKHRKLDAYVTSKSKWTSWMVLSVFVMMLTDYANAETLKPASARFAESRSDETPDFQKHVAPLLGRLGCNGRSCHGSFQGRGGFRLSLFGYDFEMDHAALTARSQAGLRIDRREPGRSLVVQKPSLQIDHEGGALIELDSWEHRLLLRWIESGAQNVTRPHELQQLEIEPSEVVFALQEPRQHRQLKVVAVWQDGTREDVTPLCRFRTNDESIATVDENGNLTATGGGDTHVIAFYDNGVGAVPVMRPFHSGESVQGSQQGASSVITSLRNANPIDGFVEAKLRKLGITPSAFCSDSEFLRRVSIDLTGTLPTPEEVTRFLADASPSKRQSKIDELLKRPAYAAWWTNRLCDYTGCNPSQQAELGQETSVQWYTWIYKRLQDNVPYDQLIADIVEATGRADHQTYDQYALETTDFYHDESAAKFSQRDTMPHYWSRRSLEKSEDKALAFAHSFLGIRLQCAQCHKHPFAPWTQQDFKHFSAFFDNVKFGVVPDTDQRYRELARQVGLNIRGKNGSPVRKDVLRRAQSGRTIPWREVYVGMRPGPARLSLLRSAVVELKRDEDPRAAIMHWMKQPENPWFAQAFVNRVWAGYFHIGIIDPPDDLNPANPPSHPALLNWLTTGFIENGYDMQWLHRQIVSSRTYQRSWKPNDTNRDDRRNFSRSVPRRIPAEVVYDSVKQAVAGSDKLDEVRTDLTRRAIGHLSMRLAGTYAMHVFGKPDRAVNCDCERVNQPTLLQSIFLHNDPLIEQRLEESGWITEIADLEASDATIDRDSLIRTAWLRTLSRLPTPDEQQRGQTHLAKAGTVSNGMRDLLWALINTKEFILN